MKSVITAVLFMLASSMVLTGAAIAAPAEEYTKLRDEVWQWTLDNSPNLATSIGDRRGDGKLEDISLKSYDRQIAETYQFLDRINAIEEASLPADLQVDYGILRSGLQDNIAASQFDHTRYVIFTNRSGWFSDFASLPNRSPFFTQSDYQSYVSRLAGFARLNDQGIARSQEAVVRGLSQPCVPMEGLAERIEKQIFDRAEQSPLWQPFAKRPSTLAEADWQRVSSQAKAAIEGSVFPAYRKFLAFYRSEYEPKCRTGTPGVLATPNGEAYYAYRVKSFTTTDMTPDEIHHLGLSEVARIRAEMDLVAKEAGYDTRESFIDHLRTDPQYYAQTPEQLLAAASALAKHIDGHMPKLFGNLPRQPYTVLPIPEAQAPGNTTAYYEPGSLQTGQAGIYRVNTTELDQRPLWELPALGVHEAVPGHHHQIALQQELDIHPLRRNGTYFTAFVEGWGLYSERLGIEMGLYDTPAKQMGRLSYEMWRAARLVVDTGIHSKGWPKDRAVQFMLDNTALAPANIDAEVNRYITWPGQALAYKVGELKIRELRKRANDALGAGFSLRAFHDAILENGAVPLSVLDAHIDRWIADQQQGG